MRKTVLGLGVVLTLFWLLAPVGWMMTTSFESQTEVLEGHLTPHQPTLDNYKMLLGFLEVPGGNWAVDRFLVGIRNSLIVGLSVSALNILIGAPAAYALGRLPTPFKSPLLGGYLVARLVPSLAYIVPLFALFRVLGLINQLPALVAAQLSVTLPITVWFLIGYLRSIPLDLDRSARADGCSELSVLWHVILPLMRPGVVGAGILSFMSSWNDFFFVLILIASDQLRTIQPILVGGSFLPTFGVPLYGGLMAGAAIAALPPVAVAIMFQRHLVHGLTSGAVVG